MFGSIRDITKGTIGASNASKVMCIKLAIKQKVNPKPIQIHVDFFRLSNMSFSQIRIWGGSGMDHRKIGRKILN